MNIELQTFVKEGLGKGLPKENLKEALLKAGWS